jgi:NADH-quinone oxidoreductase subunit H
VILSQSPTLADFGQDVWWVVLIKIVGAFVFGVVMTLFGVWLERRVIGWMQTRPGPNRVGPFGLLQTLADGIKMAFKEDLRPRGVDGFVYFIAPAISVVAALTALSVIPFGPMVSMFGERTPLQVTDVPVAVLVLLAVSALSVYGVVLGGWASGSPYPLLGGLRASAQLISYEVSLGLSVVAVFIMAGTASTSEIVAAQADDPRLAVFGVEVTIPGWYAVLLLPAFLVFLASAVAETNRAPFDLPEAESELVAGFMTEYTSLKFALFMLAEYVHMVVASAVVTTLFLGGWRAPWPITAFWGGANEGWWPLLWFLGKVLVLMFAFIWLRATLPRLRYDQLMRLGWKVLIPIGLAFIVALGGARIVGQTELTGTQLYYVIGGVALVAVLAVFLWPERRAAAEPDLSAQMARPPGSFPVPPMDLEVPPGPRAARAVAGKREAAGVAEADRAAQAAGAAETVATIEGEAGAGGPAPDSDDSVQEGGEPRG